MPNPQLNIITAEKSPSELLTPGGALVLVNKPAGMISRQLANILQEKISQPVGFAGTLDPFASGLLILASGNHTSFLNRFTAADKHYEGTAVFGISTITEDPEGPVSSVQQPLKHLSLQELTAATRSLTGMIEQVPPLFSAVKIRGKPAYWYARKGIPVNIPSRKVVVHWFKFCNLRKDTLNLQGTEYEVWLADFYVLCGKGTYIRALIRDAGKIVGIPAFTIRLVRTGVGPFLLSQAWNFHKLIETLTK